MRGLRQAAVAVLCTLACQPSSPPASCSDDALVAAHEKILQLDARLPLRTVTTGVVRDGHHAAPIAAQGLLDGCPVLSPWLASELAWRAGERTSLPSDADRWVLERMACPRYDTLVERTVANARRRAEDREPIDVYALCELDRFELIDPTRYALSGDRVSNFAIYDYFVRQGASPPRTRALVHQFFVRGPFDIDEALVEALPGSTDYRGGTAGLGVRVTPREVIASPDAPVPVTEAKQLQPRLTEEATAWRQLIGEEPPLLLAADAEVEVEVIVRMIDLARSSGIETIAALAVDPPSRLDAFVLVSSAEDDALSGGGTPVRLCAEPEQVWIDDPSIGPPRGLGNVADEPDTLRALLQERTVSVLLAKSGLSTQSLVKHLGPFERGARELKILPEGFDCSKWWTYEAGAKESLAKIGSMLKHRDTAGEACDAWTKHRETYPLAVEINDSWVATAACEDTGSSASTEAESAPAPTNKSR